MTPSRANTLAHDSPLDLSALVSGSTVQECDTRRGGPRLGLAALLQVHGEAGEGRLAEETAEGSGEELAAALLCAEGNHADLSQGRQGDHSPGETPASRLFLSGDMMSLVLFVAMNNMRAPNTHALGDTFDKVYAQGRNKNELVLFDNNSRCVSVITSDHFLPAGEERLTLNILFLTPDT